MTDEIINVCKMPNGQFYAWSRDWEPGMPYGIGATPEEAAADLDFEIEEATIVAKLER